MNSKILRVTGICKYGLIALWLVLVVGAAFLELPPCAVKTYLITDKGTFLQNDFQDENDEKGRVILYAGETQVVIKAVHYYGEVPGLKIKSLPGSQLWQYLDPGETAGVEYTDGGLLVAGEAGKAALCMNEAYREMVEELSHSRIPDRMIAALSVTVIVGFLIYLCAVTEDKLKSQYGHGVLYELKRFWKDIARYREYIMYAAKSDLNAEVSNSYLNRLWWLLEPFLNMLIYALIFGTMFGSSIENYTSFLYASLLLWNYFNRVTNSSVQLVRIYRGVVANIYIPKFVLLLSVMVLNLYKLAFSMIVLIPMLVISHVQFGPSTLLVIPACLVLVLLSFGIGMILIHFGVYMDDLSYIVTILLNMLCFLSGIFYDVIETIPEPANRFLMVANPVAVVIDTMRSALLYNRASNVMTLACWGMFGLVLSMIGVHIVYKYENGYIKVI